MGQPAGHQMKNREEFGAMLSSVATDVEGEIKAALATLADRGGSRPLMEALEYAALDGGKRMRPYFVRAGCDVFRVPRAYALRAAAAVEMIHCYSLVHDDLPCMDDDDLRRGKPSCHVRYDQATAVLVGDALLTLAFAILSDPATHPDADVRCRLIADLAAGAGGAGMVGGQMDDLRAEGKHLTMAQVSRLQRMKTGALLRFSCVAGAILAGREGKERRALEDYARDIGLAFQIRDDLLDVIGHADDIGKSQGKDEKVGKATFVSLLGIEGARDEARRLIEAAIDHLEGFDDKADPLRHMARYVIERDH